uniref:Uncharacterized protein n=1 Tax=Trypanosoma brucei TaxID=5691 RepID=Q581P0_9TRYP|nr:hypothetical protein, unlikely [Trypanosoma brucei]
MYHMHITCSYFLLSFCFVYFFFTMFGLFYLMVYIYFIFLFPSVVFVCLFVFGVVVSICTFLFVFCFLDVISTLFSSLFPPSIDKYFFVWLVIFLLYSLVMLFITFLLSILLLLLLLHSCPVGRCNRTSNAELLVHSSLC